MTKMVKKDVTQKKGVKDIKMSKTTPMKKRTVGAKPKARTSKTTIKPKGDVAIKTRGDGIAKLASENSKFAKFSFLAFAACAIMCIYFVSEVLNLFKTVAMLNFALLAVMIVIWVIIELSLLANIAKRREFFVALIFSSLGMLSLMAQGFFELRYYRQGFAAAFIEFVPMFFKFGALTSLFAVVLLVFKGLAQLKARAGEGEYAVRYYKRAKKNMWIEVACVVLMPIATLFPGVVGKGIACVIALVGMLMSYLIVKLLLGKRMYL